jgi:hypothetical protein
MVHSVAPELVRPLLRREHRRPNDAPMFVVRAQRQSLKPSPNAHQSRMGVRGAACAGDFAMISEQGPCTGF